MTENVRKLSKRCVAYCGYAIAAAVFAFMALIWLELVSGYMYAAAWFSIWCALVIVRCVVRLLQGEKAQLGFTVWNVGVYPALIGLSLGLVVVGVAFYTDMQLDWALSAASVVGLGCLPIFVFRAKRIASLIGQEERRAQQGLSEQDK